MSRTLRRLGIVALLLAGCGKPTVQQVTAQLEATEGPLDFGTVPVLNAKALDFVVQNLGRAPLNVHAVSITTDSSPAFTLLGQLPAQVEAGGQAKVQVIFTPRAEEAESGTLDLETDDPTTPSLQVKLQGVGSTRAVVTVEETNHPGQQSIDFGRVGEGQVALEGLDIHSSGTADLIVNAVELEGDPNVRFQSSSRTPFTVATGQTLTLQLAYAPPEGAPTPMSATLTLHTTDPDHQTVTVPISATVNRAPIAQIADPGPLAPGQTVQLDGSASSDPDGDDPIAFLDAAGNPGWTIARAPVNSTAQVVPGESARPQVTLDLPGQYVVRLVVTDAAGLQTLHPAERTLIAKPAQVMAVELVWDNPDTDLDLHFLPHGSQLGGAQDCWANNKQPDLGVVGDASDDPILTRDALDHFGPEEVDYAKPADGSYDIDVVFYANHSTPTPATTATVRIYLYGEIVAEYSRQIANQGQTWSAATLDWPSGDVTKVDSVQ